MRSAHAFLGGDLPRGDAAGARRNGTARPEMSAISGGSPRTHGAGPALLAGDPFHFIQVFTVVAVVGALDSRSPAVPRVARMGG